VWTPAVHPKPLPVMVWLHGGGNISGTAAQTFYDGSAFARDGVVLVTLNYRLGLLGFFAPAAIAGEAGGAPTGNFGLLDQVAALRWVRSNVAAFGGDPSRVTLFGESAGGQDALILAASDAARGLFARAIVESAGDVWARSPTLAQAQRRSADILAKLGLPRDAAAERLRAVPSATFANAGDDDQLGPIVDGAVVRAPLTETLARAVRVPIVIGTNDGEGSLLVDTTDLAAVFPQLSNDDIRVLLARYRSAGIDADAAASDLFGDAYFAAPARWVAETAAAAKQPAYLYRFDYIASIFTGRRHAATHGSEIPYVFESWPPGVPLSETDRQLERALHDCWVAFARDGVPACAAAPEWTRYDARVRRVMVFDARPSMREPGNADVLDRLQRKLLPN
jgi:para-nitrobenzyl esterase